MPLHLCPLCSHVPMTLPRLPSYPAARYRRTTLTVPSQRGHQYIHACIHKYTSIHHIWHISKQLPRPPSSPYTIYHLLPQQENPGSPMLRSQSWCIAVVTVSVCVCGVLVVWLVILPYLPQKVERRNLKYCFALLCLLMCLLAGHQASTRAECVCRISCGSKGPRLGS